MVLILRLMESFYQIDNGILLFFNNILSNAVFDVVFTLIRQAWFWFPLYVFLISFFIINFRKRGLFFIIFAMFSFGLADYSSSSIIKPLVCRVRPCNDVFKNTEVRCIVDCGSGYSFPSSHATNHFAIATYFFFVFNLFFKKPWKYLLFLWAGMISLAQVYVGVHFPSDVLAGAILGFIIGLIGFYFEEYVVNLLKLKET